MEDVSLSEASAGMEKFPVMVFSHGNGGCRSTYSLLCYEMASQGHVVASVEHADGSAACAARLSPTDGDDNAIEWVKKKVIPGIEEEDAAIRKGAETQFVDNEKKNAIFFIIKEGLLIEILGNRVQRLSFLLSTN